jgi:hypothetical protein
LATLSHRPERMRASPVMAIEVETG